jgi:hypothetical protein
MTASPPVQEELTAPGPDGPLSGTLTLPAGGAPLAAGVPVLLIVPGSGPTDRDGNSPPGIRAAPYRLLAEALARRGYPSLRIDKRGLFGSRGAVTDPNAGTIAAYGDDLVAWTKTLSDRLPAAEGGRRVIPVGHSEGGLVALAAMPRLPQARGLILIASIGRPLDAVIRDELRANPAHAPLLGEADATLAALKRGTRVAADRISPALRPLFAPQVQGFLIDALSHDPAALAARVGVPVLILQGTRDLQVGVTDARLLAAAAPDATLALVPEVNHVLKTVALDDPAANVATYGDPDLPIAPGVVEAVAKFVVRIAEA